MEDEQEFQELTEEVRESHYRNVTFKHILSEKTCPICKKKIVRMSWTGYTYQFTYKSKKYIFCSYNCYRKGQQMYTDKIKTSPAKG